MHVPLKEGQGLSGDLSFVPLAFRHPGARLENRDMGLLRGCSCGPPGKSSLKEQRVEWHRSGVTGEEPRNAGGPPSRQCRSPREGGLQSGKSEDSVSSAGASRV